MKRTATYTAVVQTTYSRTSTSDNIPHTDVKAATTGPVANYNTYIPHKQIILQHKYIHTKQYRTDIKQQTISTLKCT